MWILDDDGQSQCVFPLWVLPVIVYLDMVHWLSPPAPERGGERMGILYKNCCFCICRPVPTYFIATVFVFLKKTKNWDEGNSSRRRRILFWTTHKQAYFWKSLQNHMELLEFTWLLLRRAEFMTATVLQGLPLACREKHPDTAMLITAHSLDATSAWPRMCL